MPMAIPFVVAAFQVYGAAVATSALVSGMLYAAAAFTVIGAVTDNKDLSNIGGILGLAGGAASLASGGATAGSSAADVARTEAGNASYQALEDAAANGVEGTTQGAITSPLETGGAPPTGPTPGGGLAGEPTSGGGLLNEANPNLGKPVMGGDVSPTVTPSSPASEVTNVAPLAPGVPNAPTVPGYAGPGSAGAGAGTDAIVNGPGAGPSSFFDQLQQKMGGAVDWMKKNPELTKTGAGLLQGAMNNYSQQDMANENVKRTKDYQDWVRQRYSDSVRNLTIPAVGVTKGPGSGIVAGARN